MSQTFRWGILGCGNIARAQATALKALPDADLVACASRDRGKADAFAAEWGADRAYGSYDTLAADEQVDAVYVATPHSFHAEQSVLCLDAGKAVLCEKPMAGNAAQVQTMIDAARRNKTFLMEAMWTRFQPVWVEVQRWLQDGRIGEPRMIHGDFGFRAGVNAKGRLFDPALAGGSLLDVGIYPLSAATLVFGTEFEAVTGLADVGTTGVDEQCGFVVRWSGGRLALLSSAIRTRTAHELRIFGSDGRICIPDFWHATKATLQGKDGDTAIERPFLANGYEYQLMEVHDCLRGGRRESTAMGLAESLKLAETMDRLRAQWGVRYPFDDG